MDKVKVRLEKNKTRQNDILNEVPGFGFQLGSQYAVRQKIEVNFTLFLLYKTCMMYRITLKALRNPSKKPTPFCKIFILIMFASFKA